MTSVRGGKIWLAAFAWLFLMASAAGASRLSDALELAANGKLKEADALLQTAIPELRSAGDFDALARALSAASKIGISLGDYREAIQRATEAAAVRGKLKDPGRINEDYNTIGLANVYLGNYDAALANYRKALEFDRAHQDLEGEVERRNNIGNVFYYRGQYQDAFRAYQQAMDGVSAGGAQSWVPWRRQLTIANLAALYQRLGKEQAALDLYHQLTAVPQALPQQEYAQLLLNEGVLYRRMGDPVKALEWYRRAQDVFARARYRTGEIGALRNIGIARAMDLDDLEGARDAFTAAWKLAEASSDRRGVVQTALYRGEVFRRLGRLREAEDDFREALSGAQSAGLVDERWKARYGMGKLAEAEGRSDAAADLYRQAIAEIESVRAGIGRPQLRSEFLDDKRDVYDSLLWLTLRQRDVSADAVFSLMERSRGRSLEERSGLRTAARDLRQVQTALPADAALVEYWFGPKGGAALWMTRTRSGILSLRSQDAVQQSADRLLQSIQSGSDEWTRWSRELGSDLLAGIPAAAHLLVVPDGPTSAIPFEALTLPASGRLLVESCDVSYLPAARCFTDSGIKRRTIPPWRTELLAYGDPPVAGADALGGNGAWQPLPAAAREVKSIAGVLSGGAEIHLGADARKHDLVSRRLEGLSLLHFSTHAVVDAENPDRSRILMASGSRSAPVDYLFQREVYGLDLRGVDLATISACETARGKVVRGDGPQAFSQAFLAAGAATTVSSLWPVADRATADFMTQFYYALAKGQAKSAALRSAKLRFLASGSEWRRPRYWSAFILSGDGLNPCARAISWSMVVAPAGVAIVLAGVWFGTRRRRARSRPKAASMSR